MDDLELDNPEECPNCAGDSMVPVSCNLLIFSSMLAMCNLEILL